MTTRAFHVLLLRQRRGQVKHTTSKRYVSEEGDLLE